VFATYRSRDALSALACVLALAAAVAPRTSRASGFYLTDRGVRSLGRAGAHVAGGDDQHAAWYNPANLVVGGPGVLFDLSLLAWGNQYRRVAQPTDTSPQVRFDAVSGSALPIPVPTLIVSHSFGLRNAMFAAGVLAPNAVITSYPDSVQDSSGMPRPAPQRYSLLSLDGSALLVGGLWFAYAPRPEIAFGLGIQALVGSFASRLVLSACPATITCQPEDPSWDALTQLRVGPIFAPSGNAGVRIQPAPWITIGISGQLPMWISAPAQLQVRLPSDSFFDGSRIDGDRATVDFVLAPILRAGVEFRPTRVDRIEIAFVAEFWGMHDRIGLTPVRDAAQPNGIRIVDARAINTYEVGPQSIVRGFQHTVSVRVGVERDQALGRDWHLWPRVGLAYESSATAPEYTSVLTLDSDKFLATFGASIGRGRLRIDVVFAHVFASSVDVHPRAGQIFQVRPFRAGDPPSYAVNGGLYEFAVNVFGIGMRYAF